MNDPNIRTAVVDAAARDRAAQWLRRAGARLPSFAELADPSNMSQSRVAALRTIDADRPDPANLFRMHWYNDRCRRGFAATPPHFVLPSELTGVRSPILVALGCFFPMIAAHKVLAAYGCLIPHLVTGRFDPARQKAVWPSTGNYCRGGIAISRVLGCHGIAVLPAGMSEERFEWLRAWVTRPEDIIRTPGSESNVKEIYDRCAELARNPDNLVLNQFAEFGNYVAHYTCTGPALARIFEAFEAQHSGSGLAVFVAASGSAGTLAAGDYLKEKFGIRIA
ncbi:MAG TPA: pyridoxal-phosphate dependent enzyme, partial [Stellaceae bacterium]|nr:pyridoxal-phosphate dependent enzyme [Stellaceae bacterium]